MNSGQDAMILAGVSGALGAAASFLYVMFEGFQKLPTEIPSQATKERNQRIYFFLARIAFGLITGLIVGLWYMDNYITSNLTVSKYCFISAVSGFSANTLVIITSKIKSLFNIKKLIDKL